MNTPLIIREKVYHDVAIIESGKPVIILLNEPFRQELRDEFRLKQELLHITERPPWAPRVLDFCCGCGGFSLGFKWAYLGQGNCSYGGKEKWYWHWKKKGHKLIWVKELRRPHPLYRPEKDENLMPEIIGVDLDFGACQAYQYNNVGQAICCDGRYLPFRAIRGIFDLIIGGPPCQPFSSLNRKNPGEKHHSHDMVLWFFFWCAFYQPQAFVMENVPGLAKDPFYKAFFDSLKGDTVPSLNKFLEVSERMLGEEEDNPWGQLIVPVIRSR